MDDDDVSYPSIEPSQFDLIVVGTGLPESVVAASSSANGKSVLHLDPNSFYGGHFSSLCLDDFTSFLTSQQQQLQSGDGGSDFISVYLKHRCLYTDVEISSPGSSEDMGDSRKFNLDLSGPRVMFCADSAVELMLKSGASHHVEFKSIDASFIYSEEDGKLYTVPDSRSAIFKDRTLGLMEKNQLMRIILYAIAMADYDQESPELCKNLVTTKDGIDSLAIYHSSVGRFTNALGALIYPIYGQGELPQAFCRCAAVKGALYVSRPSASTTNTGASYTIHVNKYAVIKVHPHLPLESRQYKGLRLASGQDVFSDKLVTGPSFIVPSPSVSSPLSDLQQETSDGSIVKDVDGQVARAVCITRGSIVSGVSNLLVIFPPRYLFCTLSALCDDDAQGKESVHAAIKALLTFSISESHDTSASEQNESVEPTTLLWSAIYIQPLTKFSFDTISSCPMPDGNLDYRNVLESTEKLFHKIYPDDEFMPERNTTKDIADEQEP
ncbi:hypothetical protein IFM89_024463 [Coptis chinensis]|uniref:Rab proteins geranylgeranyltransferase component n=1 Tax=Coptis chinensis TaxID=261450 RepID=A0A835H6M7_9MAGN|nr:hypothetical protein IFM89_024463 [Coptis chinensis]